MDSRIIVWFSCGAPSAVASKLAIQDYGHERVEVVNCDTKPSEHGDNYRFYKQVQEWLQHPIIEIRNEKYADVDEVIEKTRYMSGPKGARCTTELKKNPHFPEVFKRRCEQSRKIGCRLVEITHHTRIFLDELPPGPFKKVRESLSCGPDCGIQMPLISPVILHEKPS